MSKCLKNSRKNIQILYASSLENTTFVTKRNFFQVREQVTVFLYQLRQLIYADRIKAQTVGQYIRPISIYFDNLSTLPIADVLHSVHSNLGNEVN